MSDRRLAARLRAHRDTLVILVIGIVAFGFLAHEDRAARHAGGIDDTCAWFQMVNRQFPMNRCYSLDEFLQFVGGRSGNRPDVPTTTGDDE